MKRILFICLIFIGCEKEPNYCWECWKEVQMNNYSASMKINICGVTKSEIEKIIKDNTFSSAQSKHTMRCNN